MPDERENVTAAEQKSEEMTVRQQSAALDLPSRIRYAEGRGAGVNVYSSVSMALMPVTENGTQRDATGAEIEKRWQNFRFKNRLKEQVSFAFSAYDTPEMREYLSAAGTTVLDTIRIGGQSPEQKWGEKYASVADQADREMFYKIEIMNAVLMGSESISAEIATPVQNGFEMKTMEVMPEGSRHYTQAVRETAPKPEEISLEDLTAEEPEPVREQEPRMTLTDEGLNNFQRDVYSRIYTTSRQASAPIPAALMVPALYQQVKSEDGTSRDRTPQEIVQSYRNMPYKRYFDNALTDIFKEVVNPEREAFLSNMNVSALDTIRINGQTPGERWGEKYAFVTDPAEKQDLYKAEIIREIMDGKSVLSVDRYALYPDNWWTMTEETTLDIDRHVRTPEGERRRAEEQERQRSEERARVEAEAKAAAEAEALRQQQISLLDRESSILQHQEDFIRKGANIGEGWKEESRPEPTKYQRAEDTSKLMAPEDIEASWDYLGHIYELHKKLKKTYDELSNTQKESHMGMTDTENTNEFKKMMSDLQKAVNLTDLSHQDYSTRSVTGALEDLRSSANAYYQGHKGFLFGPATSVGRQRLKGAKDTLSDIEAADKEIDAFKKMLNKKGYRLENWPLTAVAEKLALDGDKQGIHKTVSQFEGVMDYDGTERVAKEYVINKYKGISDDRFNREVDKLMSDDLFMALTSTYPQHAGDQYEIGIQAREYLAQKIGHNAPFKEIWNLMQNPDFERIAKRYDDRAPEMWDRCEKARETLEAAGRKNIQFDDILELASSKVFREVLKSHPEDYVEIALCAEKAGLFYEKKSERYTTEMIIELAENPHFQSMVQTYPDSVTAKWEDIEKAKEYLNHRYASEIGDFVERPSAEEMNVKAEILAQNPDFLDILRSHPNDYVQKFDTYLKAESYLNHGSEKHATREEIRTLAGNKIFEQILEKEPVSFATAWDENKKAADEIQQQMKQDLAEYKEELSDYKALWKAARDNYNNKDMQNETYEKGLEALAKKKDELSERKYKIADYREELKTEKNPDVIEGKERAIAAFEKDQKMYKSSKIMLVENDILPEYLAKMAVMEAAADPVRGEQICRAIAEDPNARQAMEADVKSFFQASTGKEMMRDPKFLGQIKEGKLAEKAIFNRPEKQAPAMEQKKDLQSVRQAAGM